MGKKILIMVFIIAVSISFYLYKNKKPWMLSLYRNGKTVLRIDYSSKEQCILTGNKHVERKEFDRFDCGYKCSIHDKNDLESSPICKSICDDIECK